VTATARFGIKAPAEMPYRRINRTRAYIDEIVACLIF